MTSDPKPARPVFREDHELFRETVRRFIRKEWAPRMAEWNRAGRVERELWWQAGREGILCPTVPERYGGGGGDFGHAAVVTEEIADAGVGGAAFGLHSDIAAPYIVRLGTEAQKRRWLPDVCAGRSVLAIAITEPDCGSDVKALRTTARRDGDEYVIDGSKTFITNGLLCDLVIVACKTDPAAGAKGVSLVVVEADRAGFQRGRALEKVGHHAQDTAELHFDGVRVPVANRLGAEGEGFRSMMQELPQERFLIALSAATRMERLLKDTVAYVKSRKAFDGTLWDFQNTRFKLADIQAEAMAMRAFVDALLQAHIARRLTAAEAAAAKLYTTETLWRAVDAMVQLHGGYGYMLEHPIARAFVDNRVLRIYGGSNEVMRELIARDL
jgi:acyl-CoA dehydrogenase